jgi:peroxiredoxin
MFRTALVLFCFALASFATAGEYNEVLKIGDSAPAWDNLPGVDGKQHSLGDLKDKKVVVVVFTCNSCPAARDYEDRIIELAKSSTEIAIVAINVNRIPDDSMEKMIERAKSKGLPYPYLFDETQKIAKQYGANFTPEFFVLDGDRKIVYMGSMDDNTDAKLAKNHYARDAIAAVLAGKQPNVSETLARGCRVRYAREPRK